MFQTTIPLGEHGSRGALLYRKMMERVLTLNERGGQVLMEEMSVKTETIGLGHELRSRTTVSEAIASTRTASANDWIVWAAGSSLLLLVGVWASVNLLRWFWHEVF